MTLQRSFFMLLAVGMTALVLFGCSSDGEEEDILAPEDEVEEVVDPEPPMGWDGGRNIRVMVGGKTEKELYDELYEKELLFANFLTLSRTGKWGRVMRWEGRRSYSYHPFYHPFPLSEEQYIIDVTVISMLEAGMDKPATIEEIRARYREIGCRPMTAEEVFYLRLQFTDQPPLDSGNPLGEFFALMEDNGVDRYGPYLLGLAYDDGLLDKFVVKKFIGFTIPNLFDPHSQKIWHYGSKGPAHFACVKIQ